MCFLSKCWRAAVCGVGGQRCGISTQMGHEDTPRGKKRLPTSACEASTLKLTVVASFATTPVRPCRPTRRLQSIFTIPDFHGLPHKHPIMHGGSCPWRHTTLFICTKKELIDLCGTKQSWRGEEPLRGQRDTRDSWDLFNPGSFWGGAGGAPVCWE